MSTSHSEFEHYEHAVATSLHEHWVAFFVEGIVLIALGVAAIVLPVVATLAVTLYIGFVFLVAGGVGLITTLWMRHAPGFWWSLLSAVLTTALGVILLASPVGAAVSLTLLLAIFFAIEGLATIMFAFEHKRGSSARWSWMVISGIVDLILATVIITGLPGSAVWAIGLLVGLNMLFGGLALVGMALHARTHDA